MNPIDPNTSTLPTVTTTEPPIEKKWSGRRIAIALIGALATVALVITGIFLVSKRSSKEENKTGDADKIALGEFLQVHNNPKFDGELARVLQTMEEKKHAKREAQVQSDALYAQSLNGQI